MLTILIPMAGEGIRFKQAGFVKPKPFIDINGKPMIMRVMENLAQPDSKFVLVGQTEHFAQEQKLVQELAKKFNIELVELNSLTEGAACTVLQARKAISVEDPLLIANSDQLIDGDISNFLSDAQERQLDGSILTFEDATRNPKWSFAKINSDGLVSEVREKVAISSCATVGLYWFKKGQYFINAAIDMISRNERVNNEFYNCPVYNYMIADRMRVGSFNIKQEAMHGLGTPEDLKKFLDYGPPRLKN